MYAIPYTPEPTRQKIMSSFNIYGIPTLIVMDSTGKVITTSGQGAVEGNPDGCVDEWLSGKPGVNWTSNFNWKSLLFYIGIILFYMWWARSKRGGDKVHV
jgi:hypothetical protein